MATVVVGCALGATIQPAEVAADSLATNPADTSAGYIPVEELSYEVLIKQGAGYRAEVRLRVALHNTSADLQDAVLSLGLPRGAELTALNVARGGEWSAGIVTDVSPVADERGVGGVFVRNVPPATSGDVPAAEVVAFGIESGATVQVEVVLEVNPTLRGERWHLDLPHRGFVSPAMAGERRVVVQDLGADEEFWVDGISNDGAKFMGSSPNDTVTVSWPASVRGGRLLGGLYEVTDDTFGKGGTFRLVLRLGQSRAAKPDHVVVLVDRSRSGGNQLQKDTFTMLDAVLDKLPASTTYEVVAFARDAHSLIGTQRPRVGDEGARRELEFALGRRNLEQGTNLAAGLQLAAERLADDKRSRRPMVMIVTDGMLPLSADPVKIASEFRDALGKRRAPEVLFVVDDPLLARTGLPAEHPVATAAAALGARISLETLRHVAARDRLDLLSAPKVLGDLSVSLPRRAVLHDDVPSGLVAGNFVVLEGKYEGRAPASVKIRGKLGKQPITTKLSAQRTPAAPDALVASTEGPERLAAAAEEGFALPKWYTRRMAREARTQITQAGRSGHEVAGQLDDRIFRRYLRLRVLPRTRVCFNRALARNQTQAGRVLFDIEVGKGEVMAARVAQAELVEASDPAFIDCLTEAAWALDIPAGHLDDRVYRIRYPISFAAPEGAMPPSTTEGTDPIFELLMERADVLAK